MTTPAPPAAFRAALGPHLLPLRDHLVARLRAAPLPPLDDEMIVVQSQGMRQWLQLQLADAFSCSASLALPFPRDFVRLVEQWSGLPADAHDAFSRDVLSWRIELLLRSLGGDDPHYAALLPYLRESDDRMRVGLAARVAARFDDYQLFRPELLAAWEAGASGFESPHATWQAALWRALCAGTADSPARRISRAREILQGATPGTLTALPPRISVFGISSLPPRFIELLAALGRHADVCVYAALLPESTAHPLATSFGTQGRVLQELLRTAGATLERAEAPRLTTGAVTKSLLHTLHGELVTGDSGAAPLAVSLLDASLRVHSAHGMVRELEVIRDQLYDAFASDRTLRPEDVLVLVPDVTEWAPTVNAVFGVPASDATPIPYSIADRRRRELPAADAFVALLALEGGRLAHSELVAVLQHPMVRRAAGLDDTAVEWIAHVTHAANVRWGYDESSLLAIGLPTLDAPTWRTGVDRLLVGYTTARGDEPVLGVLPEAGDTSGDPESLARFSLWLDFVGAAMADWKRDRSLQDWCDAFDALVAQGLAPDSAPDSEALLSLHETIGALAGEARAAGHGAAVSFSVVREWLEGALSDEGAGSGFLSGRVTIASLKPMRSLPFRVIAIAGLDDASFPRRDRHLAFDLIAREPRAGDRNLREDDRQLFLDLLLAAGDRLILSWSGRAARDNSVRAPSVVLDELLDHLDRRSAGTARSALVVQHPLQPFSPRYFGAAAPDDATGRVGQAGMADQRLFTYSGASARAATAQRSRHTPGLPFGHDPLPPETGDKHGEVTLRDLTEFWQNPARWYCRRTLRFSLSESADEHSDAERFALDYFRLGGLRHELLRGALDRRRDAAGECRRLIAAGTLPPGALGAAWHAAIENEMTPVREELPHGVWASAAVRLEVGEWLVTGTLDRIVDGVRHVVRGKSFSPKNRVHAWVEHVVMCAARQSDTQLPTTTKLIGLASRKKNGSLPLRTESIGEVAGANAIVADWLELLNEARLRPLPFFCNAGVAWLDKERATNEPAMRAVGKAFSPFSGPGDEADPYVRLCYRADADILAAHTDEMMTLAARLCPAGGTLPWK